MILFFIFLAVLVIGIVMVKVDWESIIPWDWDTDFLKGIGFLIAFIASGAIAVSLLCFICLPLKETTTINSYYQDKVLIENACNNDNLTGEERASVLTLITQDNTLIINTKFYRDNPFTSWFTSKKVAELPLFDINMVPKARTNIQNSEGE